MQYQTLDESASPTTLLLKGAPGSGKTTLAAQLPAPLIFNFDNNLAALRLLPQSARSAVRVLNPRFSDKNKKLDARLVFDNFIEQLSAVMDDSSGDVQTVVFDSLSTMCDVLWWKILGSDKPGQQIQLQHWGAFSNYLQWFGSHLLCASDLDKTVVVLAHEYLVEDKVNGNHLSLNIGGQMKDKFDLYFTDCWRTFTKKTNQGVNYMLRTAPGNNFSAKCTMQLPQEAVIDSKLIASINAQLRGEA